MPELAEQLLEQHGLVDHDTTMFFVVPAYQRFSLTAVCLNQLRNTCTELAEHNIQATAVVIADDDNLDVARELGFYTVERENEPLGRKFNDGIELACQEGADYVVPFGTDNWIDHRLLLELPRGREVVCHTRAALVRPDGQALGKIRVGYQGGDGIRTFPAELFERVNGRPANEHAKKAIDASIAERLKRFAGWNRNYRSVDLHDLQLVGFQSSDVQLNDYSDLMRSFEGVETYDPWTELATVYPQASVEAAERHYRRHA